VIAHNALRRLKLLWLSAWPLWVLVVFASLAVDRLLPEGYARAVVAAPVLLLVPGSLTLGAAFSQRRRPQGTMFVCYTALLSVAWSAFASLVLYVFHVLITADSTFWCLLTISTALAAVAEARLMLGRGTGRRAAVKPETLDPDLFDAEADEVETSATGKGRYYTVTALVAGISLLAGGLYAYNRLPHPAPTGYTWLAWAGPPVNGDIDISPTGTRLNFRIVHHQPNTATFKLTAAWQGSRSRPLAKALTVSVGPNRTFRGSLFIPPLPDGCTYRVVVVLTAAQQINVLAENQQTWSINADVHDPRKPQKKACASL
jgi:hypothetical protein